jgi:multicomponent Na+:H+ antiporter subunit A
MDPETSFILDWTLLAIVAPFAAAFLVPSLNRMAGRAAPWLLALIPAAAFVHFILLLPTVASGLVVYGGVDWLDRFGIPLTYSLDGLSLLFVLLANLVGALALIDCALPGMRANSGSSLSSMLLLIGSIQALVLADGLIALVICCGVASAASAWAALGSREAGAGLGTALAMLAVALSGTALLLVACMVLIHDSAGYDDGRITSATAAINAAWQLRESGLYRPVFAFAFSGVCLFAAQVPVFLWLRGPGRMPGQVQACFYGTTALTPVYLLMRVHPFLGDTPLWSLSVPALGALVLIGCAVPALRTAVVAHLIGWLAVASLGLMFLMIGTSLNQSVFAATAMVLTHALAIPALAMMAGRDGATKAEARIGAACRLLAGLSLCGAPLTIGYVARGTFYAAMFDAAFPDLLGEPAPFAWLLQLYTLAVLAISMLGGALMVAALLRALVYPPETLAEPAGGGKIAYAVPAALALAGIAAGLGGAGIAEVLLNPARFAINLVPYDIAPPAHAAPDAAFGLIVLTFVAGALIVRFALHSRRPA